MSKSRATGSAKVIPKPSAFSCDAPRHRPTEEPESYPEDPGYPLQFQGPKFDEEVRDLSSCLTVVQEVQNVDFKVTDREGYDALLVATHKITKLALALSGTPLEALYHRALDVLAAAEDQGIIPDAVDSPHPGYH